MKFQYNTIKHSQGLRIQVIQLVMLVIACSSFHCNLMAQTDTPEFTTPSWWFGGAAAANGNLYQGSTQQLTDNFKPPTAFHDGMGIGLYAAPLAEFHKADSRFGAMLQVGYDNRSGKFEQVTTPCNCPADLAARLSYLTIEPSFRFAPFKKGLFVYAGPRLAFNLKKEFTYKQGTNPDVSEQIANDDVKGNFSNVNDSMLSMQIGLGYDIPIFSQNYQTQMVVSPFIAFHPYFGQDPRSIETWNISTLRLGAIVKFGFGRPTHLTSIGDEKAEDLPIKRKLSAVVTDAPKTSTSLKVEFSIDSPENIPEKRVVRESFPVNNYVFFDLESTKIPSRYVQLNKAQVSEFEENKVELYTPENLSGRSDRQMVVYYNVLNILGDRMVKNPNSTIKLSGASDQGNADGKMMAESVKTYLVSNFDINSSRISTVGTAKPSIPSEQPGATKELVRLRQEDRRVTIESTSPELLMEYQSGPDAALKPVEIVATKTAPVESYVTFKAAGARKEFSSWRLEVKDEQGTVKMFGPFQEDEVTLPGKSVLGERPNGDFNVTMIGKLKKNDAEERQESNIHVVLWTPSETEEVHKYSIVYGYNKSNSIALYDKYVQEVIVPQIPKNGTVIIHGYTDDIGNAFNNKSLSLARANDAKKTMQKALVAEGRTDVKFKVYGFGEDPNLSPFNNKYPEERLYNRSVIIDLVPSK